LTRLFRALPGVDAYIQSLDDFVVDAGDARDWYDVVLFYNFHQETPGAAEDDPWWRKGAREALERLGETDQGIVVLHHALLAFRAWPFWSNLVGIEQRGRGFHPNQRLKVHIADPDHPITQGMEDWEIVDETYTVDEPGPDNHVILTTDHDKSMNALAWTRRFGEARVFCYASGHDARAFENPNFQTVLARGIAWTAAEI
jgi:type 1 glutamine amidotransferase